MRRLTKRLTFSLILLVAAAAGGVAALYLMPVSVALGPCLKDWTNLTSYRRRESPLDYARLITAQGQIKICYGRPSARGRIIFGSLIPYGEYWRIGANEPTRVYTDLTLRIGDVEVPPGRYSLYALPGREHWELIVNRSTGHWGNEFSPRVLAREVGRDTLPVGRTRGFVEALTIRLEATAANEGAMTIAWEHTRIDVPLAWRTEQAP